MAPPLVLDIDRTLIDANGRLDPRAFEVLPVQDVPVIPATGKAFPYSVSLCYYLGLPQTIIAGNGGVVLADGEVTLIGGRKAAQVAADEFVACGGNLGQDAADTANRQRETEIIACLNTSEALLRVVANESDVEVTDTDFIYHTRIPGVGKGVGLERVYETVDHGPGDFVVVGDSANDVSIFRVAGRSCTVASAGDTAKEATDTVFDRLCMDDTLSVLDLLREEDTV